MTRTEHELESLFAAAADPRAFVEGYLRRQAELLAQLDRGAIAGLIERVERAVEQGQTVFFIGNGGSSAVAAHVVNDLCVSSRVEGQPPVRAFSLTDNVPSITAIANDAGYENIFLFQLEQHLRPGDVVIAFSVSGNSPNVVKGLEYAKGRGAVTVGICGFDGGWLRANADHVVHVPTTRDEYGPVESIFSLLGHVLTAHVTLARGRRLSH